MKRLLNMMKAGDIVLLVLLIILSFLPVFIFSYNQAMAENDYFTAVVSVDGEMVHEFTLVDDDEQEVYEYRDDHGHINKIIREGTTVYMVEASCPDQLCVRQGEISAVGETIVCLPHRLLVEIQSNNPDADDDLEIDAIT